jgi:hypothetical protein
MVLVRDYIGNLQTVIRGEFVGSVDLIVEGGASSNLNPMMWFREAGYTGNYVRMDLRSGFPTTIYNPPIRHPRGIVGMSKELEEFLGMYDKVWNVRGNCFNTVLAKELLERFGSKAPAFYTHCALATAALSDEIDFWEGTKDKKDIMTPEEAAENISKIHKKQLHVTPAGFSIASEEYMRRHKAALAEYQAINPIPNLHVIDTLKTGIDMRKHFIYEAFERYLAASEKDGWEIYLMSEQFNVLFMKKN